MGRCKQVAWTDAFQEGRPIDKQEEAEEESRKLNRRHDPGSSTVRCV